MERRMPFRLGIGSRIGGGRKKLEIQADGELYSSATVPASSEHCQFVQDLLMMSDDRSKCVQCVPTML